MMVYHQQGCYPLTVFSNLPATKALGSTTPTLVTSGRASGMKALPGHYGDYRCSDPPLKPEGKGILLPVVSK